MADTENVVKNVIPEHRTGYIRKVKLEDLLRNLFGKYIFVEHISERWVFYAPREVTDAELRPIIEDN
ncbi:uncharacterized protein PAC_00031 [Phialocephala subalpina]|uniref:Uncharacterized protein n=1 Tax=Phialocephala subalpina TaxID=576137 RepID=A0A1L7WBX3_9HELO|nr:uncharacterized protein PAC_00031 [Phialocephala subalpina]